MLSLYYEVHPHDPQPRLIRRAAEELNKGDVIAYPTDSSYALACRLGDKDAAERIRRIRHVGDKHHLTLVCSDLSEIATYAKVDNSAYRLLKARTPGAYTFILKATHEVPRRLQHPKRKTIGIRVPDHPIVQALLAELRQPIMSSTLHLPGQDFPETDPHEFRHRIEKQVDLIIDGGPCAPEETTVVDLTEGTPRLIRVGCGDVDGLE